MNDCPNRGLTHIEQLGQSHLRKNAPGLFIKQSDSFDRFSIKPAQPEFVGSILKIICLRSQEKMFGVETSGGVTGVKHAESFRDFTKSQSKGVPVNKLIFACDVNAPISFVIQGAGPQPAFPRDDFSGPEFWAAPSTMSNVFAFCHACPLS